MTDTLVAALRERASALGFVACGIAPADRPWPAQARLAAWIEAGHHGTMNWMADTAGRRGHPLSLWSEAHSAVVLGASYAPDANPLDRLGEHSAGLVSVYAARRDYHEVIKGRLKTLAGWFAAKSRAEVKVFVDTAPLMEKPLAARAGIGWQGKHTNLVSRAHGSWLFLGTILTNAALSADVEEQDHCGTCQACLDVCPTQAFPAPYQLDARRCLAYLTIEHAGPVPEPFRRPMGNRIFGCDDCLAVCPWNKFAETSRDARLALRPDLQARPLDELAALDEPAFRVLFAGTPVKRTGRDRFVRNVLIAIGNSADMSLVPAATALLDDQSGIVRGAAVWALRELLDAEAFQRLKQERQAGEPDPTVRAEWGPETRAP